MAPKLYYDPHEPAHPSIVKLHDDLVAILKFIREKYQVDIDRVFDRVSSQVGFVVTTTVPVKAEVDEAGIIKSLVISAPHLEGSLFKEILSPLKEIHKEKLPVAAGTYNFYLIWFPALKLKLKTDWMEPAHLKTHWMEPAHVGAWMEPAHVAWEVREPAHWFHPGTLITPEEGVLIEALDVVYPELRLVERISHYRRGPGQTKPSPDPWKGLVETLQHAATDPSKQQMIKEVMEVVRKYGK